MHKFFLYGSLLLLVVGGAGYFGFLPTQSITNVACPSMTVVINGQTIQTTLVPASVAASYYNVQSLTGAFFLWQVNGVWTPGTGLQSIALSGGYVASSWGTTQSASGGPLYVQVTSPWFVYNSAGGCGIQGPPTTTSTSSVSTTSISTSTSPAASTTTVSPPPAINNSLYLYVVLAGLVSLGIGVVLMEKEDE